MDPREAVIAIDEARRAMDHAMAALAKAREGLLVAMQQRDGLAAELDQSERRRDDLAMGLIDCFKKD